MKRPVNLRRILYSFILSCFTFFVLWIVIGSNYPVIKSWIQRAGEIEVRYNEKKVEVDDENAQLILACMKKQYFYPVTRQKNRSEESFLIICSKNGKESYHMNYDKENEVFYAGYFDDTFGLGKCPVNKELITVLNQYLDKTF